MLAQHAGNVVTHNHLLKRGLWGKDHTGNVRDLRIFVRKLRSKIEKEPARLAILAAELGVGYRLRTD